MFKSFFKSQLFSRICSHISISTYISIWIRFFNYSHFKIKWKDIHWTKAFIPPSQSEIHLCRCFFFFCRISRFPEIYWKCIKSLTLEQEQKLIFDNILNIFFGVLQFLFLFQLVSGAKISTLDLLVTSLLIVLNAKKLNNQTAWTAKNWRHSLMFHLLLLYLKIW